MTARGIGRIHSAQEGIASIGAIFILMAVAAAGAMFGYAATHENALAALRLEAAAQDALDRTSHIVMVTGPVYVQDANGDGVIDQADSISFDVAVAPGAIDADLSTMSATLVTDSGRTTVAASYDGDPLLERGETVTLTIAPPALLAPGQAFSVELSPADGPTTAVTATMPAAISGLMTLRY